MIYALICQNYKKFYIGQNSNELQKRMTLHRRQTVSDEFRVHKVNKRINESSNDRFNVVPNYKVLSNNAALRDEKEQYLINVLSTALAKNHAKPAKGDTSHVTKMNIFRFSQFIMS